MLTRSRGGKFRAVAAAHESPQTPKLIPAFLAACSCCPLCFPHLSDYSSDEGRTSILQPKNDSVTVRDQKKTKKTHQKPKTTPQKQKQKRQLLQKLYPIDLCSHFFSQNQVIWRGQVWLQGIPSKKIESVASLLKSGLH